MCTTAPHKDTFPQRLFQGELSAKQTIRTECRKQPPRGFFKISVLKACSSWKWRSVLRKTGNLSTWKLLICSYIKICHLEIFNLFYAKIMADLFPIRYMLPNFGPAGKILSVLNLAPASRFDHRFDLF